MATPKPTEHKRVQARILKYAQEIGWKYVPQSEAEQRRCEFNPKFKDTLEELLRKLNLPFSTIAGNRDFLQHRV